MLIQIIHNLLAEKDGKNLLGSYRVSFEGTLVITEISSMHFYSVKLISSVDDVTPSVCDVMTESIPKSGVTALPRRLYTLGIQKRLDNVSKHCTWVL